MCTDTYPPPKIKIHRLYLVPPPPPMVGTDSPTLWITPIKIVTILPQFCKAVFQQRYIVPLLFLHSRIVDGINHNLILPLSSLRTIKMDFEDHCFHAFSLCSVWKCPRTYGYTNPPPPPPHTHTHTTTNRVVSKVTNQYYTKHITNVPTSLKAIV